MPKHAIKKSFLEARDKALHGAQCRLNISQGSHVVFGPCKCPTHIRGLHVQLCGTFDRESACICRELLLEEPGLVLRIEIVADFKHGQALQLLPAISALVCLENVLLSCTIGSVSQAGMLMTRVAASCPLLSDAAIVLPLLSDNDAGMIQKLADSFRSVVMLPKICNVSVTVKDKVAASILLRVALDSPQLRKLTYEGPIPEAKGDIKLGRPALQVLTMHGSTLGPRSRALVAALVTSVREGGTVDLDL